MISRSHKIENMSFLAACCVVVLHAGHPSFGEGGRLCRELLTDGICRIAVPFFFIVSGYFLAAHFREQRWWRRECAKRVRSILVPYVVWSLSFACLVCACVLLANVRAHKPWTMGLCVVASLSALGLDLQEWPLLVPFWYVRALLILCVCSPVLIWLVRKVPKSMFVGLGLASLLFTGDAATSVSIFFVKTMPPFAIFCFCVGLGLRVYEGRFALPTIRASIVSLCLGALFMAIGVLLRYSGRSGLPIKIEVVFVSFILFGIWRFIPSGVWPRVLTSGAFPIFCLHFMFLYIARLIVGAPSNGVVFILGLSVVGILGPLTCAMSLRSFAPKIATLVFGGR